MEWDKQKNKIKHYQQFRPTPTRKAIKPTTDRRTWTAYIQLKLGHGYYRSYLYRIGRAKTNRYTGQCQGIQSPIHLYQSCQNYKEEQKELRNKLREIYPNQEITLTEIYSEKSRETVYNYLKKTRVATREWLLGQEE
jgi:hypothetical protein